MYLLQILSSSFEWQLRFLVSFILCVFSQVLLTFYNKHEWFSEMENIVILKVH